MEKVKNFMKIFNKTDNNKKEFYKDFALLKQQVSKTQERFSLSENDFFPCLSDKQEVTLFDTHYIYHPAWAARIIKSYHPAEHVDISSTLLFVLLCVGVLSRNSQSVNSLVK